MKRGEIYYIKSNYREIGSEQWAGRPAVIVSNNNNSEVVEIAYMTTRPKNDLPTHVVTRSTPKESVILCEQITSVSVQRVGARVGTLSKEEMRALDVALAISLGLDFIPKTAASDTAGKIIENPDKPEPPKEENTDLLVAQIIKATTERDLYKKFSEELLEIIKGGARE